MTWVIHMAAIANNADSGATSRLSLTLPVTLLGRWVAQWSHLSALGWTIYDCPGWHQQSVQPLVYHLLLFYTIATVFQLYHSGDMMYEMRRRKPEPTLLVTQWIFNLPHHIGMKGASIVRWKYKIVPKPKTLVQIRTYASWYCCCIGEIPSQFCRTSYLSCQNC